MLPAATEFEREKAELNALLASGIFDRAPNWEQLLVYICSRYFEGQADQIKEYNLAVEALGRRPNFDQKRDSIVRVELHLLRRRLREYYQTEGAGHSLHIVIPLGQYAPKFVPAKVEPPVVEVLPSGETAAINTGGSWRKWLRITMMCLSGLAAAWIVLWALGINRGQTAALAMRTLVPALQNTPDIRILAGVDDGDVIDGSGRTWSVDRYFDGGKVSRRAKPTIIGALDPLPYRSCREGVFSYDIPLKPGIYELRLHFAETLYGETNLAGGGETSRIFNVLLNGSILLHEFDVIADAGPNTADVKVFKEIEPAPDGKLHLRFEQVTNLPFVNAIEITPGIQGRIHPIAMVARDRGYTDKGGRYWTSDRYAARGGQLVLRPGTIVDAPDPGLYEGERFGNLTYSIPVPEGRYAAIFRFAETWFGPNKPARGGEGSREFDILCNGVVLIRGLDIYRQAGGSDRPVVLIFHGLSPNHQGKIVISMIPSKNYACINALELVDESQ